MAGLFERIHGIKPEQARNQGKIEGIVRDSHGNVIVNPFVKAAMENRLPVQTLVPARGNR